jgi:hypothetical protein
MDSGVSPPTCTTHQVPMMFKMLSMQAVIGSMMMESMSKTWADTLIRTTEGDSGLDSTTRFKGMDSSRLLQVRPTHCKQRITLPGQMSPILWGAIFFTIQFHLRCSGQLRRNLSFWSQLIADPLFATI